MRNDVGLVRSSSISERGLSLLKEGLGLINDFGKGGKLSLSNWGDQPPLTGNNGGPPLYIFDCPEGIFTEKDKQSDPNFDARTFLNKVPAG